VKSLINYAINECEYVAAANEGYAVAIVAGAYLGGINGVREVGGICGRLGERRSFITTSHSGGTPTLLETLFTRHLKYTSQERAQMVRRLNKVIIHTVSNVSRIYPNLREFAVDIMVDEFQIATRQNTVSKN